MALSETLTGKQRDWLHNYLYVTHYNAVEAARLAGYGGSYSALGVIGHDNLKNAKIRPFIEAHFAEKHLSAKQVLSMLAEHANASMAPFLEITGEEDVAINLASDQAKAKWHTLKKVKTTEISGGSEEKGTEWKKRTVEIEVVDSRAALQDIGRHHKLFTDRVEHDLISQLTDEELLDIAQGGAGGIGAQEAGEAEQSDE